MAKTVSDFPSTGTRATKYPFDEWFNGQVWELTEGVDFHVPVASFRGAVYNRQNKLGITVRTTVLRTEGQPAKVYVQRTDKSSAPTTPSASQRAAAKEAAQ